MLTRLQDGACTGEPMVRFLKHVAAAAPIPSVRTSTSKVSPALHPLPVLGALGAPCTIAGACYSAFRVGWFRCFFGTIPTEREAQ